MKRIITLLFLFVSALFAGNAQNEATQDTIKQNVKDIAGNKDVAGQFVAAYDNGDFAGAIKLLEREKDAQKLKGLESAGLYYNLGNAYFRNKDIAHAILNYERALLLNPGDRDTRHNIAYASTQIKDKILVADTFFLTTWINYIQHSFSANTWATVAVISFLLFIGFLFLFFFGKSITIKKASFYAGIVLIILVISANIFTYRQKQEIEHRTTAIIMVPSVSIKSSPDINSKELFILHSGTKVKITKEDRRWLEIEISDGNVGWIQRDALEII